MSFIDKVLKKIMNSYYKSNGKRLLAYYRHGGVKIGEGTVIFNPKDILIDDSRPELLEIGKHVFGLLGVLWIQMLNFIRLIAKL